MHLNDLFDRYFRDPTQLGDVVLGIGRPPGANHQRRPIEGAVRRPHGFDFIRDDRIVASRKTIENGVEHRPVEGRKDDHRAPPPQFAEKERQRLQPEQRQQRGGRRHGIHPRTRRQAHSGRRPKARRRRQAAHHPPMDDDRSGTDESDAAHDLRGDARRIEPGSVPQPGERFETVLGDDHHQRRPQSHQEVRAEAGLLVAILAVEPNNRAAQSGDAKPCDQIPYHHMFGIRNHRNTYPAKSRPFDCNVRNFSYLCGLCLTN